MLNRITFDPALMGGRACIRGMRIPVSVVVNLVANGMTPAEIADLGVSLVTVRALRGAGHEVVHLREQGLQRLPDPDIFAKATGERRIILTA